MILGSRRLRHAAFGLLVGLQVTIALTGNYAFFNLLAARTLSYFCWTMRASSDAAAFPRRTRRAFLHRARRRLDRRGGGDRARLGAGVREPHRARVAARPLVAPAAEVIAPLRSVNTYGLFAVMTTTRPEIIIEGSDDGIEWKAYEFAYKPGDLHRRPPWVAPHQPRLDWQMWFAALSSYDAEPWFQRFCRRLLEGSPDVLRLLAYDPFAGRPPRYVRATLYRYRFSDRAARRSRRSVVDARAARRVLAGLVTERGGSAATTSAVTEICEVRGLRAP